uniref:Uncharacterized protein n=2 Tax=Avena sativa TaxID=4498 RepID=A0ACD5Z9P1_AVESA
MEGVIVSAATGALKPVLGKLATLVGDEYKRFKGVRTEIKSLAHELAAMDAFLLKMSEEENPHVQDKAWMAEVRELFYDMEDSIDDFMKRAGDKDNEPDGFIDKIKSSLGKMKARRRIGNEIEDLKNQITQVGERNSRYKARETYSKTINSTVDPRALAIFEHAANLVGIDEPKREVIKLLAQKDGAASKQDQVIMVSIVGSGGMGKKTLANQVYQELGESFECQAFLSVSRNADMKNILRTILSKVSNQRYGDTEEGSVQQLIMKIRDFLLGKRYLIVVDDVWEFDTWAVIERVFPTSSGSRIIKTTRMKDIAHSCCSSFIGHIYNINPLCMEHARLLFHGRLFNSEMYCPSNLKEVSHKILIKCQGLPLAIIAISGLLANTERIEHLWNKVENSIGRALERNHSVEGMMNILSLSYFDLPPHLKTCRLYLCVFPEDCHIGRKSLIRQWIAEGFIHKDGRYMVEELGERYFNELVNRSLIQPVEKDKYGKVKSFLLHDTILDFITSKSIEENFVTLVGVPDQTSRTHGKVRRLSLQAGKQETTILLTGLELSHVRTILVYRYSGELPSVDKSKHLRVLEFQGCRQLANRHLTNVGRLFQLRYLNVSYTRLSELPEQIGYLRSLEMLDIRGTSVNKLPASIVNLRRLVYFLSSTGVIFPDGISKMEALEILKRVSVFKQSVNVLQEVGKLKNLRKLALDFTGGETGFGECKRAIASSIHELCTRNTGLLTISKNECIFLVEASGRVIPDKLMGKVMQIPNWVGFLVNLQDLHLEVMNVGQEDLCILGGLPALLTMRELYYQQVTFRGMDLIFAAGSMPKLEKLEIEFNAAESDSLSGDAFDFGIENLRCILTLTCRVRGCFGSVVAAAKAALERTARIHPNNPTLLIA